MKDTLQTMIIRAEKVAGGYAILIPEDVAKAWELHDGSAVEVYRFGSICEENGPAIRHVSAEEALAAFELARPRHEAAYRDLAKGPEGMGPHDPLSCNRHR